MDIVSKSFSHLASPNVSNSMQSQAVIDLVVLVQVLPDGVYDKTEEVRVFVH